MNRFLVSCPSCGAAVPGHGGWRCLSLGRALSLLGGLGVLVAYWVPWIGNQQGSMAGNHLAANLARNPDLSRMVPGFGISPQEVELLKTVVNVAPFFGAVIALLALLGLQRRLSRLISGLILVGATMVLVALAFGARLIPPGARAEIGLQIIGLAAGAAILGALFELFARGRRTALTTE